MVSFVFQKINKKNHKAQNLRNSDSDCEFHISRTLHTNAKIEMGN